MHSPTMESSLEADSTTEEPKVVGHVPCYHPFHSSFDIGLVKNLTAKKSAKEPDQISTKIAENTNNRKILCGGIISKPWARTGRDDTKRLYHPENRSQTSNVFAQAPYNVQGTPAVKRNPTIPANRLDHKQTNSMWFYPNLLVPATPNLTQYSPVTQYRQVSGSNYVQEGRRSVTNYRTCGGSTVNVNNFSVPSCRGGFPRAANAVMKTVHGPHQSNGLAAGRNSYQDVQKAGRNRPMVCNFCKNNKEVPDIYLNHYLYDPKTRKLTCPVLRKHVCEICGETGDRAHTLQYCPINRQKGLQAKVPVLLKTRTITNSTGKIRRN